ncbi:MAG: alpha/beta hydrolase [Phyllobacterium sp.]
MAYRLLIGILPALALMSAAPPALAIEPATCDSRVKSQTQSVTMNADRMQDREIRPDNCAPAKGASASVPDLKKATSVVFSPAKVEPDTMPEKIAPSATEKSAKSSRPAGYGRLYDNLSFRYRLYRPEDANGQTIVLMHGSGATERSLVPLARKISTRATLLAVRGRVIQDGSSRWYKRITPVSFDQNDIRKEANAFVDFMDKAVKSYDIDLNRTIFLGYSNGANLLSSVMLLHPGLIRNAVLLRSMPVLNDIPRVNLSKTNVLVIAGENDTTYAPFAPALEEILKKSGARVEARTIASTHAVGAEDAKVVSEWLTAATATAAKLP